MDYNYQKAAKELLIRVHQMAYFTDYKTVLPKVMNEDMVKIYHTIANECKGTVVFDDLQTRTYESPITKSTVERIVWGILRGETRIPKEDIQDALYKDNAFWNVPTDLFIAKGIDAETGERALITEDFVIEDDWITRKEGGYEALDRLMELYGKGVALEEYETASKQNLRLPKIGPLKKFIEKMKTPKGGYREAVKTEYERIVREYSGITSEELIQNSVEWKMRQLYDERFIYDILDSIDNGTAIEVLRDQDNPDVFNKTACQIGAEAHERIKDFPNINKIFSEDVAKIYSVVEAQLVALSLDLREATPEQIEEYIKRVNYLALDEDKREHIGENGYRNVNVGFNNKDEVGRLLEKERVPDAMKLLGEEISKLVNDTKLTDEEYLEKASMLKYRFVRIHPFPDANGRTSRALMNMMVTPRGMITEFPKEEKREYAKVISKYVSEHQDLQQEYKTAIITDSKKAEEMEEHESFDEYKSFVTRNTTIIPDVIKREANEPEKDKDKEKEDLDKTQPLPIVDVPQ